MNGEIGNLATVSVCLLARMLSPLAPRLSTTTNPKHKTGRAPALPGLKAVQHMELQPATKRSGSTSIHVSLCEKTAEPDQKS